MIAKDILKFHTVYWPAFLMAAGIEPPQRVYVHGYLLMGEKKMSKSLGNVLDPNEVIDRFGSDALRFYCMREVSFGQDGSVSAAGFESRYETELANDWGNLASRTLAMIERYRDGVVPEGTPDPELGLEGLDGVVRGLLDDARALARAGGDLDPGAAPQRLRRGVEAVGAREGRRAGSGTRTPLAADRLDVLYNLAEGIRFLALLLHPYMPESSGKLLDALAEGNRELDAFGARAGGADDRAHPAALPEARLAS